MSEWYAVKCAFGPGVALRLNMQSRALAEAFVAGNPLADVTAAVEGPFAEPVSITDGELDMALMVYGLLAARMGGKMDPITFCAFIDKETGGVAMSQVAKAAPSREPSHDMGRDEMDEQRAWEARRR